MVEIPSGSHPVLLDIDKVYHARGEQFTLTTYSDVTSEINVRVYDPDQILMYDKVWNSETRTLPIAADAKYGDYFIEASVFNGDFTHEKWLTVVDDGNFTVASLPWSRTHKNVTYTVYSDRRLVMERGEQQLTLRLPDLPNVSITPYVNQDMFVARLQSGVIDIDLVFVFVAKGIKLVIRGKSDGPRTTFKFKLASSHNLVKWARHLSLQQPNKIGFVPWALKFDWRDLAKAWSHITYDAATQTVTVHDVPQTFQLDPTFGEEGDGDGDWNFNANLKYGTIFTLTEDGDITNISARMTNRFGSGEYAKCMIYNESGGDPNALQATSAELEGDDAIGWDNFVTTQSLTAADYCLAVFSDSGNGIRRQYEAASGYAVFGDSGDTYADGPEATWASPPSEWADYRLCIHADYTVGAPGLSIPVAMHHYGHHISKIIRG